MRSCQRSSSLASNHSKSPKRRRSGGSHSLSVNQVLPRPADSLYTNIEELPEAEGDLGTEWLQHRMGDETSPIIVCWNSLSAVETDAQLFVPFWEDFCYPSSDDVAIFPIHFGWLVTFWHEEHLFFGRRR